MKRPYLAPKNDGAPGHVVNVDIGKRARGSALDKAPWEKSKPGARRPVRPRATEPVPEPAPASSLSIDPHASAAEYSTEEAASFWSLPSVPALKPSTPAAGEAVALSGPAEEFDVATGWSFPALDFDDELEPNLRLSAEERAEPILPSADELFSTTPSTPEWSAPAPAPPAARPQPSPRSPTPHRSAAPSAPVASAPVDVESLLTRGRELLSAGELQEATLLLRRARRAAPDHNSVATWLEFAERRLMREHIPAARADSVPTPTKNRRHLAAEATPVERQMLSAIDGLRNVGAILGAGTDEAFVPMLKMLAAFEARGWITWN